MFAEPAALVDSLLALLPALAESLPALLCALEGVTLGEMLPALTGGPLVALLPAFAEPLPALLEPSPAVAGLLGTFPRVSDVSLARREEDELRKFIFQVVVFLQLKLIFFCPLYPFVDWLLLLFKFFALRSGLFLCCPVCIYACKQAVFCSLT